MRGNRATAWVTKDKKRKRDELHLFWVQKMLYDYKEHERKYA